ncbi:hypothetical protein J22TS1_15630 [Siminovitchia terrae]|uniref:hypothetical protein n=1 Tax=Siminovitchia terrae TaxID=1914933 RepID=UPI001B2B61C6|nr:hypothetical protein [Siminovitchia terrae]GIN90512.1 hypothetical protein J22TS1_15630 [Siminovitchia terrae]
MRSKEVVVLDGVRTGSFREITAIDLAAETAREAMKRSGVEPKYMGISPVPAILQALEKANIKIGNLDLIEINEAFGAQYLACQKELDFDPTNGNVNGGAIALDHPLGASGARISLSLLYELKKRNKRFGASALCIGGGQGIAAIWESL